MADDCETKQTVVSYGIRVFSICFAILSNAIAASYLYYKLYKEKVAGQTANRAAKIDKPVIQGTFIYIFLSTFTTLYNLLYRFIIPATDAACLASDIIDEYLIVFSRTFLLLFFTYRVENVFKSSSYAINAKKMLAFRVFVVVEFVTVNTVWIAILDMSMCVITEPASFGVYCKNGGNLATIFSHFAFESIFYIILLSLFITQLTRVTRSIQDHSSSPQSGHSSTPKSPHTPSSLNNQQQQRKTTSKSSSAKRKKSSSRKFNLLVVALRQTVFVFISILSTWVFYLGSVVKLDGNDVYDVLRWFYPLDGTINVWCIVLMFKFVEFKCIGVDSNSCCGRICDCCTSVQKCCPCMPDVWKQALTHYSEERNDNRRQNKNNKNYESDVENSEANSPTNTRSGSSHTGTSGSGSGSRFKFKRPKSPKDGSRGSRSPRTSEKDVEINSIDDGARGSRGSRGSRGARVSENNLSVMGNNNNNKYKTHVASASASEQDIIVTQNDSNKKNQNKQKLLSANNEKSADIVESVENTEENEEENLKPIVPDNNDDVSVDDRIQVDQMDTMDAMDAMDAMDTMDTMDTMDATTDKLSG